MTEGKFHPDHIAEHVSEIQAEIAREQGRLVRDGWGKGPAYYQACENVGQEDFYPSIGGPKLASKVGRIVAERARDAKFAIAPHPLPLLTPNDRNGSISIVIGDMEDIPADKARGNFSGDPNVEHLKQTILDMPIGKALPAMFENRTIARKTAKRLYAWAAHIHSKDNGWMLRAPSIGEDGMVKFLKVPYHKKG